MALKGSCWAMRLQPIISSGKASSENVATPFQLRSNQPLATHMMALTRPKPIMARLTTNEPKCAQLPIEKSRMMQICSSMMAPATRPTAR
jgi:hypothetical protein